MKKCKFWAAILICGQLASFSISCGGASTSSMRGKINAAMGNNNWPEAIAQVEANKKPLYAKQNAKLLYFLDKSYLQQHAGMHKEAAAGYEQAIQTIDDLYTKSIRREIGAAMSGETVKDYTGTDYEKILAHIYAAINYGAIGDLENARVEARRVSDKLQQYNEQYDTPNAYKDDAFAHWLSGWLLESEGDEQAANEAKIEYHAAYDIYNSPKYKDIYGQSVPYFVTEDLLRSANYAGISDTISKIIAQNKQVTYPTRKELASKGQILFIHQAGVAPRKEEQVETVSLANEVVRSITRDLESDAEAQKSVGDSGVSIRLFFADRFLATIDRATIAYPVLINNAYSISSSTISAANVSSDTVMVEDIEALAAKVLADDMPRLRRRAITRTVTKNILSAIGVYISKVLLQKSLQKAGINAPGPTVNDFRRAYEIADKSHAAADTRSWFTLPAQIRVAKLLLDPGEYTLNIDFRDQSGAVIATKTIDNVRIVAGKQIIITERTVR